MYCKENREEIEKREERNFQDCLNSQSQQNSRILPEAPADPGAGHAGAEAEGSGFTVAHLRSSLQFPVFEHIAKLSKASGDLWLPDSVAVELPLFPSLLYATSVPPVPQ